MNALLAMQALKEPLQFGNLKQIAALKVLYPAEATSEGKKRYRCDISVEIDETVYVYADDQEDARDQAREEFDLNHSDFKIRVTEVVD